jgi:hypothetical protein
MHLFAPVTRAPYPVPPLLKRAPAAPGRPSPVIIATPDTKLTPPAMPERTTTWGHRGLATAVSSPVTERAQALLLRDWVASHR